MEDVCELLVRHDLVPDGIVRGHLRSNDDVLECELSGGGGTLQIGHWLFLLMTRIL